MPSRDRDNLPVPMLDANSIAIDLARHYPDIPREELYKIAVALIEEVQATIRRGDRVAAISQKPDGSIEISYLTMEPVRKAVNRLRLRMRR